MTFAAVMATTSGASNLLPRRCLLPSRRPALLLSASSPRESSRESLYNVSLAGPRHARKNTHIRHDGGFGMIIEMASISAAFETRTRSRRGALIADRLSTIFVASLRARRAARPRRERERHERRCSATMRRAEERPRSRHAKRLSLISFNDRLFI